MFNRQANTRPADHPPSSQPDIPRKGKLGGGKTWPASFSFVSSIPQKFHSAKSAIKLLSGGSFPRPKSDCAAAYYNEHSKFWLDIVYWTERLESSCGNASWLWAVQATSEA